MTPTPITPYVYRATLHELFMRQVQLNPEKIALVQGDVRLTYRELDEQSNRLANYLRRYEIAPHDAVGILLEKCYEYIVVSVAILKAGGAYLHLELAYPHNFLREIFVDAGPKVVISKRKHQHKLATQDVCALYLDDGAWLSAESPPPPNTATNDDLAIIGYSSGSTGKPKGVLVSHRATLYAYENFWGDVLCIGDVGRFAYTTFMLWDALSPLVMGQTGYMVADEIAYDPHRLLDFIAEHQINHTVFTPSLLSTILQTVSAETIREKLACLNIVWVGGEVMTQPLVNEILRLLPHLTLINNYGPTECFVITQGRLVVNDPATPTVCSVGRVLDRMEILLLDDAMRPVPYGEVGELYATGPCLADGYLNNPTLTERKFRPIDGKLFYRTGDSARYLEDGRLIVLGRRDATVKLRSYNVNMLAIEEQLRSHPAVDDCCVTALGAEGEDKLLVAYLLRAKGVTWEIDAQRHSCPEMVTYLQAHLPFYMIPRLYIELDELPLNPISGKLDRARLPVPPQPMKHTVALEPLAADATSTEQENLLIALLEQLLPHATVTTTVDLFEIGLHSLLAAQLAAKVRELFSRTLSVVKIYEYSTVARLIAFLNTGRGETVAIDWQTECQLDAEIVPVGRAVAFSADSNAVFLTGATGYLGTFLLAALLRLSSKLRVYCLVRSAERLIRRLNFYQLWDDSFANRIVPLVGDLEQPRFGWSQTTFERYAAQVNAVFHAGAWVNMVYPYATLQAANVGGTREVLRFTTCCVDKPLHYVSTLGILPVGNASTYPENDDIDHLIERLKGGYTQSKWVAEQLVWQARARGVSAEIYRIGNIGPDTRTHLPNPNDTVMLLLDTCKRIKLAPFQDDWFFEYTPVDIVAHAIIQTALSQQPISPVYHIASQRLLAANMVFNEMVRRGLVAEVVERERWIVTLRDFAAQTQEKRYRLLEQSLQVEEQFLLEREPFDTTCFIAQMRHGGIALPIFDNNYLIQSGFAENHPQFY